MPLEQSRTLLHSLLILALLLTPLVGLQHSLSSECQAVLSGSSPDSGSSPISAPGPGLAASCLPWRIEWWEEAARLSLLAGNAEDAIRYLERGKNEARRIGRENGAELSVNAEIDLAVSQQALGEPLQAVETWKRIAARAGLTEQVAARLVELHILRGDYPAAIAVLQMLSHAQPENAEVHARLGFLLSTQDPEKSLPHFEKAAELNPVFKESSTRFHTAVLSSRVAADPAYTLVSAGRALASLDRWELASEAFHQAVLKHPDFADAWAYLGEARQHTRLPRLTSSDGQSQVSDGFSELQTALQLDPDSLAAHTLLAFYWIRQSRFDQALESLGKAVALAPDNPILTSALGEIQAASGDLDGAYDSLQKAARLASYDPTYQQKIIRFALDYHYQIESIALPLALKLLTTEPEDPIYLDLIAQVMIALDDIPAAKKYLSQALQIDPGSASAHLHQGIALMLEGNTAAARQSLERASSLDSHGPVGEQARRLLEGSAP